MTLIFCLVAVTDAIGQVTTLTYGLADEGNWIRIDCCSGRHL